MVHLYSKLWENYGTCHFIYDLRVLLETGLIVKIAVSLDPFIQRHTHIIPQTRGNKNRIRKLTYIYIIYMYTYRYRYIAYSSQPTVILLKNYFYMHDIILITERVGPRRETQMSDSQALPNFLGLWSFNTARVLFWSKSWVTKHLRPLRIFLFKKEFPTFSPLFVLQACVIYHRRGSFRVLRSTFVVPRTAFFWIEILAVVPGISRASCTV